MAFVGDAEGQSVVETLIAAGLHDPTRTEAAEELELLRHLVERGATLDFIRDRLAEGDDLYMVATSLTREWPRSTSVSELAHQAGTTVDSVARIRLALGFAMDDPGARTVRQTTAADVELFQFASGVFGEEAVLAFARVLGSSAARIADAANVLFGGRMATAAERTPTMLEMSQANELAVAALDAVPGLLGRAITEHLGVLSRRLPDVISGDVRAAVVFVDLVGSTVWAGRVSAAEHAAALTRFEAAAWDLATRHGGRLVKLIGDEAMFVAEDPGSACSIAHGLCGVAHRDAGLPEARAAVGYGPVQARDGDYFGPIVNIVARATKEAAPGEVVAVAPLVAMLRPSEWSIGAPVSRTLRGVDDAVELRSIEPAHVASLETPAPS